MSRFVLPYGDERIPYVVRFGGRQTTRVAVHVDHDGSVTVDVPPGFTGEAIQRAVGKRARWIASCVAKARQRYALVRPREYVSGEEVLYLGHRYVLKLLKVDGRPGSAKIRGNRVEVETETGDPEDVKRRLKDWYRVRCQDYFTRRIDDLSARMSWISSPPPFRLRSMKRQWGSCSPAGEVVLNPDLIKASGVCIDYVLVHELVHLKHRDHGSEFLTLIDLHAPGWEESKKVLDAMVEILTNE